MIQVISAGYLDGNDAKIKINEEIVSTFLNENKTFRGLHIVVFNPVSSKIESAKTFDTYKSSVEFENFIKTPIRNGHIVAAACKDDCVTNLSEKSKAWFREIGSKEIDKLEYRQGFAFIGIYGQKNRVIEKRGLKPGNEVTVQQVF